MLDKNDPILNFEPLWMNWVAEDVIGEGTYGRVYRVSRQDAPQYKSAVKHISIPGKFMQQSDMGAIDEKALRSLYQELYKRIIGEIEIMYALRGEASIVSYEDYASFSSADGLCYDIFIRMELLTPLDIWRTQNASLDVDVRRLGIDICNALSTCQAHGIIHRDIKEENVFVDSQGVFKLGDFGIARELSLGTHGMSIQGTPSYIAPEVYHGHSYDARADIYSLGILLYKLLNEGRYPFLPAYPQSITADSIEQAFIKRIRGDLPMPPLNGDPNLQSIVMRAIEPNQENRFSSAQEMRDALVHGVDAEDGKIAFQAKPSIILKAKKGGKSKDKFVPCLIAAIIVASLVLFGLVTMLINRVTNIVSKKADEIIHAAASTPTAMPTESIPAVVYPSATANPYVTFHDPVFENIIRQRLNQPYGNLARNDLESIESLAIIGDFGRAEYYNYYVSGDSKNRADGSFTYEDGIRYSRGALDDLSDIIYLKNLKHLYISCTSISDIQPLAQLQQLETLQLSSNVFLADISPLANLVNLKGELSLWRNDISDLSPLSGLYGIDALTVSSNNITDLSPLENLTNLQYINLYKNQVMDITPLMNLRNLTYLQLNENNIFDITPLINLQELRELRIQNNNVGDIYIFYYMPNLQYVNVRGNPIQDYEPLSMIPSADY